MLRSTLINKINSSDWWHVPPLDKNAYKKRGKFLASTYLQAEFYGRPNMQPEKVNIKNPVYGFSELEILRKLSPTSIAKTLLNEVLETNDDFYEKRKALDKQIYKQAKSQGFDAVILMTESGRKTLLNNRKPHSIELNILNTQSVN